MPGELNPLGAADFREFAETVAKAVAELLLVGTPQTLNGKEARTYLGMSKSAFSRARAADELPKPVRVPGAGLRYRRKDLELWVEKLKPARRKNSSAE